MSGLYTVEAFSLDAIGDGKIERPSAGHALSPRAIDLIMSECPVVVALPLEGAGQLRYSNPRTLVGYDPAALKLSQPTPEHQRSFHLQGELIPADLHDRYGNHYGAVTVKGNNFTQARAIKHPTAVNEVVAYGLQESKIIERVVRASEVLRERNIATEWIVGLAEPRGYPYPLAGPGTPAYEVLNREAYTKRIAENYWKTLPETERTLDKLTDMVRQFQGMTFYVSMRAMDTAYRLGDIRRDKAARSAFFAELKAKSSAPPPEEFDLAEHEKLIAANLGTNLARLHIDLKHGFLHPLNITALGGIVDLDSVSGAPLDLGDDPITGKDRALDVQTAVLSLVNNDSFSLSRNVMRDKAAGLASIFWENYTHETMLQQGPEAGEAMLVDICLDESLEPLVREILIQDYMSHCIDADMHSPVYEAVAADTDKQFFAWLMSDTGDATIRELIHTKLSEWAIEIESERGESKAVHRAVGHVLREAVASRFWHEHWRQPSEINTLPEHRRRAVTYYLKHQEVSNCFKEVWPKLYDQVAEAISSELEEYTTPAPEPFAEGLTYEEMRVYRDKTSMALNLAQSVPLGSAESAFADIRKELAQGWNRTELEDAAQGIYFNIKDQVTDIITDGYIDGWMCNDESGVVNLDFDNTGHPPATYIIFVRRGDTGVAVTEVRIAGAMSSLDEQLALY